MRLESLVILSLLFTFAYSSHFYGGFFTAEPYGENSTHFTVKFYVRLGYKRSWMGSQSPAFEPTRYTYCDQTTIATGQHIAPYYYIFCDVGCPTLNEPVGLTDIACISYSVVNDWSYGENSFTYDFAKNTKYEVYYYGASWISVNQYTVNFTGTPGAWNLRLKIDTTKRTDTKTMNNSPRTLVPPIFILRNGMAVSLHIPQFDTDGDTVKCRWSLYDLGECEYICDSVPFATLNSTSCMLEFNLTSYAYLDGWYGAALQIEDFQTQSSLTPLSSTPLQFLIKVISSSSTCTIPPKVDFYYCMFTEVNKPFTMTIKATAGCPGVTVNEITITGPTGLTYTETSKVAGTTNQYSSTLTWTPSMLQLDEQIICVTAMDNSPLSSDVSCVTVFVYQLPNTLNPPALVTGSGIPKGTFTIPIPTSATFKVQVNKAITRPVRTSYIYIKGISSGTQNLTYDMTNSSVVSINVNSSTNYSTISFNVPLSNLAAGSYYVAFDNPFAISSVKYSKYCTQVEVSGIDDPSFWNFTIPATTTTSTTTTTVTASGATSTTTFKTTVLSIGSSQNTGVSNSASAKPQTTARLANSQSTTSDSGGCSSATCQALSSTFGVLGGIGLALCSTGLTILGIVLKRRKRRVSDDKEPEEPENCPKKP